MHAVRHDRIADDKGLIKMLAFMCLRSHSQASPERNGVATIRKGGLCYYGQAERTRRIRPRDNRFVGIPEDGERED
jgi:hypothetical protein